MDARSELDARIARLEAALAAATTALSEIEAAPDRTPELEAARAELAEARARIEALEAERDAAAETTEAEEAPEADDPDETIRLRRAVETLTAASAELRAGAVGAVDRALEAEVEALRAARAMDLAEMEALLAELDPMLQRDGETANA